MPNLICHSLFADDVLERLNNPVFNERRMIFLTGGQGPDFLFFHHSDPFSDAWKSSDIRKYGNKFHYENINAFYISALHSISNEKNADIAKDMLAYVCGHLCHWAMDSTIHPMVYARTGLCSKHGAWRHHQFESMLDAALLMYRKKQTIATYDAGKECILATPEMARAMARIYVPAIEEIYGEKVRPTSFYEALVDWQRLQKVFRDPKNRKKKLLRPVEKALKLNFVATGYSIPDKYEDNVDICNLLHKPWPHPVTGELSTASVFDLIDIAMDKAIHVINLFVDALNHPGDSIYVMALSDYLGDRNYEMNMSGDVKPVFFDLIDLSE